MPILSGRIVQAGAMAEVPPYLWRDPVSDDEMVELVRSHGGRPVPQAADALRAESHGHPHELLGAGADSLRAGCGQAAIQTLAPAGGVEMPNPGPHPRGPTE